MTERPSDEELFSYLLGEAAPERVSQLEAWSRSFPEQMAPLSELLQQLEAHEQVELVAGVDARLRRHQRRRALAGIGVFAAAAACAVVGVVVGGGEELRTKGSAPSAEGWAGVALYGIRDGEAPRRLEAAMGSRDGLLVAYVNGGERPFSHLSVFGVASDRSVFWYYPAWLDQAIDPMSISIVPTSDFVELPDRISHDLPRGRLVIHAVFSREPLHVSELERLAVSADDPLAALPLEDVAQQRFVIEVP